MIEINVDTFTYLYFSIKQNQDIMMHHELLSQLSDQIKSQVNFVKTDIKPLSEVQLKERPHPEKWHTLEIIAHLNQYAQYYIPILEKVAQTAKPAAKETFKKGWLGGKFIQMMSPNNTKPQKTLKHMNTLDKQVSKSEIDDFLIWQEKLLNVIEQLEGKNLNQHKISVEFMWLIKMKIGDALQFVVVHQQRHINQINSIDYKINTMPINETPHH